MAIIDILTLYDAKKKAAHAAKTVKHGVSAPRACSYAYTLGPACQPLSRVGPAVCHPPATSLVSGATRLSPSGLIVPLSCRVGGTTCDFALVTTLFPK